MNGKNNFYDGPSGNTSSSKSQYFKRKEIRWLRENLFNGLINSIISVVVIVLVLAALLPFIKWAFINSVWQANSYAECREIIISIHGEGENGACWAVFQDKLGVLFFGFYPPTQYWRPIVTIVLLPLALLPILFASFPRKLLWFSVIYPVVAYILLWGGFGLEYIETHRFGGFLLTLIVAVSSTATAIIIGVILALCRPFLIWPLRVICAAIIEIIRGVPTIILLFSGFTILNYLLPIGVFIDPLFRAVIIIALPSAILIAETVRGCLIEIPQGQLDAARALGLGYRKAFWKIIMPQTLRNATPQITLISGKIFRDTSLLSLVGFSVPVWFYRIFKMDGDWHGAYLELFLVIGLFYWFFCFSISSYSKHYSRKLNANRRQTRNQAY